MGGITIQEKTDILEKKKQKPYYQFYYNHYYLARATSSNHLQYVELLALNGNEIF